MQEKYSTSYYDLSYPGLILKINLNRKLSYHLVQVSYSSYMLSFFFHAHWMN